MVDAPTATSRPVSRSPAPSPGSRPAQLPTARLYLGTRQGLLALDLAGRGWRTGSVLWRDRAINALAIDPADPRRILASVEGAGLHRSEDGGEAWRRCLPARLHALATRPDRPELIYAGAEPPEVYRSTDSGEHWTALRADAGSAGLLAPRSAWRRVRALAFEPENGACVYAGIEGGGIVKSFDGGRSWIELAARGLPASVQCLLLPPDRPGTVLAGTREGVFVSEDEGFEWTGDGAGLEEPDVRALACLSGGMVAAAHVLGDARDLGDHGTPDAGDAVRTSTSATSGMSATSATSASARLYHRPRGSIRWWPASEVLDGAVSDVAFRGDGEAAFVGTTGGSLWGSVDGGRSWRRLARGLPPILALALG